MNCVLLALFDLLALGRKFAKRIAAVRTHTGKALASSIHCGMRECAERRDCDHARLVELELFKICNCPMTGPDHRTCVGGRCPKWDGTRSGDQSNDCNETEDTLPARTLLHEAERVARKRTANLVHRPISRSRAAE